MKLCDNCLEPAVDAEGRQLPSLPLGHDRGSQRDPYRAHADLCLGCQGCLGGPLGTESTTVDLAAFHARHRTERHLENGNA